MQTLSLHAGDDFTFGHLLTGTNQGLQPHVAAGVSVKVIASEATGGEELLSAVVTPTLSGVTLTTVVTAPAILTATWPAGDHLLYIRTLATGLAKVQGTYRLRVHPAPVGTGVSAVASLYNRVTAAESEAAALRQALAELRASMPA